MEYDIMETEGTGGTPEQLYTKSIASSKVIGKVILFDDVSSPVEPEVIPKIADILKRIEDCFPENPYPESIFPMTEDEYIKFIPDPHNRTAVSGCVGRFVFEATKRRFLEAIKNEFEE